MALGLVSLPMLSALPEWSGYGKGQPFLGLPQNRETSCSSVPLRMGNLKTRFPRCL
ncbi:hypothetical protein HMPREF9441_01168 [Paraprevotella clara YIT 11840]|uniref:Uncharacterized protein n=1 Tax=Paraprevotella clara YIT 11840 TaxID=762968 RepID=G5SP86_9BACT|nr:hypothetical protein HMPREF9441_01168 [Paraprevotella clara YIT 11840]